MDAHLYHSHLKNNHKQIFPRISCYFPFIVLSFSSIWFSNVLRFRKTDNFHLCTSSYSLSNLVLISTTLSKPPMTFVLLSQCYSSIFLWQDHFLYLETPCSFSFCNTTQNLLSSPPPHTTMSQMVLCLEMQFYNTIKLYHLFICTYI